MRISVIPANRLPEDLALRWAQIQQDNAVLFSPFFRPEFSKAVAKVRNDVLVAVIDNGTAFFPFQRNLLGIGRPVGGALSDYHGLISPQGYRCDVVSLIRACKLQRWDFDHVPGDQTMFAPCHTVDAVSYIVDTKDYESQSADLNSRYAYYRRRLERDLGPVEFEWDASEPEALQQCMEWKSDQYRRTEVVDLFARPWARSLVEVIASTRERAFAGIVSVLRAGGRPVAIHFGMRTENALHYWFPAYDRQSSRYSPGMLLLLEMITHAPKQGISVIDFGKGDAPYKQKLANRLVPLMEGSVAAHPALLAMRQGRTKVLQWARTAPLLRFVPPQIRKMVWLADQSGRYR